MKKPIILTIISLFLGCSDSSQSEIAILVSISEELNNSKYLTFDEINSPVLDTDTLYKLENSKKEKSTSENAPSNFEFFKARYDTIIVDNIPYYIVEGDLFMDEDELYFYYTQFENIQTEAGKLTGITIDGNLIKMSMPITYTIIKSSFPNEEDYLVVKDSLEQAAKDWSRICNVNFIHKKQLDEAFLPHQNSDEVTFVVRYFFSGGKFLAKAFFPYDPKVKRKLLVEPRIFSSEFSITGVFRHELGHILGFRHEHIRSESPRGCNKIERDLNMVTPITIYDPQSVMHYFCDGVGTFSLEITHVDSIGASLIYPF